MAKDRKERSEEQKRIASFIEGLNLAIRIHDHELAGSSSPQFVRHKDGYNYRIRLGKKTLNIEVSVVEDVDHING